MRKLINHLSLRSKILSILLTITLLLSGFSLILVQSISDVNQVSLTIRDEHVPSIVWLTHWENELVKKEQFVLEGLENDFCCEFIETYNQISQSNQLINDFGSVPMNLNSLMSELNLLDFLIMNELQGFIIVEDVEEAKSFIQNHYMPALVSLKQTLHVETQQAYLSVQENTLKFSDIIESALTLLVLLTAGSVILSIFFSFRTSSNLTSPIEKMISKVNRISNGQYGLTIEHSVKQVELQQLASSINQMSNKLKDSFDTILNDKIYREQILNSLPVGIMTIDAKTNEITLNQSAKALLNVEENMIEAPCEFPHTKHNKEFWNILYSKEICENVKVIYHSTDGKRHYLVSQSKLLDQDANVIGRIFYFIDVTTTEQLENRIHQSEKLALVGEMAAGAAHEIRNPLAVIQGFLSIMEDSLTSDQLQQFHLPLLMKELERINFIIEEMLLLAKPSAPNLKKLYLEDILQEIMPLLQHMSESENISINLNLEKYPLKLDVKQMKQVFYNLIRNSREILIESRLIPF